MQQYVIHLRGAESLKAAPNTRQAADRSSMSPRIGRNPVGHPREDHNLMLHT
ncbi:hypothetical protein D3C76_1876810 [compost metagenome]